jgi:hypothetical protein
MPQSGDHDSIHHRSGGAVHDVGPTAGRAPVTARLSAPPVAAPNVTNYIFRVADVESARALGESLRGDAAPEASVQRAAASPSAPLPDDVRLRFESCLDTDLTGVRVHTGAESESAAAAVGARAYATGQDIHFGADQYDPGSSTGLHLLAHEVAHTVQQRGGASPAVQHKLAVSSPADALEHDADRVADALVSGQSVAVARGGDGVLSREDDKDKDKDKGKDESINFDELDAAFQNVRDAMDLQFDNRKTGAAEVLDNLEEVDPPPLAAELLKTLAVTALSGANGFVSTLVADRAAGLIKASVEVSEAVFNALRNGISTGLKDGLKDATTKIASKIDGGSDDDSRSSFFASQDEGLNVMRASMRKSITGQALRWKTEVRELPADERAAGLDERVKTATAIATAIEEVADGARSGQYQHSLKEWLSAQSRGTMGERDTGTDLRGNKRGVDMSPDNHYTETGATGIVYIDFGPQRAERPFTARSMKLGGITEAVRSKIKGITLKQLGYPIVATGHCYDGAVDAASIAVGDNELGFGMNEGEHVFTRGHVDALAALMKATGADNAPDAARIVLDGDFGGLTLDDANLV